MQIPLNRVVAFFGPLISIAAAAIATWLVAKANVLAIPGLGLNGDDLTIQIAGGLTFALTSALSWLGQSKWLKGVHIGLANDGLVQAAALTPAPPSAVTTILPADELPDVEEDLPDDAEEFASPPGSAPIQPTQAPDVPDARPATEGDVPPGA